MRNSTTLSRPSTRLLLDHGADETSAEHIHIEERGLTFESPWEFPAMSELSICLTWHQPRAGARRTPTVGIVLASRKIGVTRYETTVLFLEMPGAQMEEVREFARRSRAD